MSLARFRTEAALYAAIAAGSVLGSLLRWLAGLALAPFGLFPWGTLFVNGTGSFAIGLFAGLTAPGGRVLAGPKLRQFAMTGVCGGYTTFSAFSLEAGQAVGRHALGEAALYVGVSLAAWIGAAWVGEALAARFNRLKRG